MEDSSAIPQYPPTPAQEGSHGIQHQLVNPPEPSNPPRKRRRAAIACPDCRMRKTKCDHIVPRNTLDGSLRDNIKGSQAWYIRSLEQRLQKYERKPEGGFELPKPPDRMNSWPQSTNNQQSNGHHATQLPHRNGQTSSVVIATSPEIFIGGGSGVSFTQLILNAMNRGQSERLQAQSFSSPRDHQTVTAHQNIYTIPPDSRELLHMFFDFHHKLSPIFHIPTISAKFEEAISCDMAGRVEHAQTLALMNMLFAMATSHQRLGPEASVSATRRFYDTAMALAGPTLLYEWTIEKVQMLLVGARYLQSANYPDECWNVLGLAIRIAYGLELHRPPPDDLDCITKEVRKRVWYECFILDKLLSMIYGRPPATSTSTFTTPLPEDLDDDCIQPNRLLYPTVSAPSNMSFFLQVSKLYRLLEWAASLAADPPLETLAQLDEAFEAWYAEIPEHLTLRNATFARDDKALILALRANMVRILIHRHSLASTLSMITGSVSTVASPEGLRASMLQSSRTICVRTAEETIQLVSHRHEQTKHTVGPSWFNLYYLFNAILIIVSHVVDPEYHEDKSALNHLDQAMHMIRQMSANHTCAQRAYAFLHQLLSFMDKTLTVDGRKIIGPTRPQSRNAQHPGPDSSSTIETGYEEITGSDLFAFWDITQDLTTNLGTQLESYDALGSNMWSWGT